MGGHIWTPRTNQHYVVFFTLLNGKEFAYHEQMAEALAAQVYFADPYSSWKRDSNENTNGLLRQYRPKKTDLKQVPRIDRQHIGVDLRAVG